MGRYLSQCDLGDRGVAISGGRCGRSDHTRWDLAYTQHNLGNELPPCCSVEFLNQCRFEECELVQPDTVVDQEIKFLVANLVGPGIRCHRLSDDGDPVPPQAVFEQLGLEPKATSHPFEDVGERIDRRKSTHGGIIAKTSAAISKPAFSGIGKREA